MSADHYLDARAAFERIHNELVQLGEQIRGIGNAILSNPGRFAFSNTIGSLPAEALMSSDLLSANADEWPTAAAINEKLAAWHKAKSEVEDTWQSVPEERQKGLRPPPFLF